MHSYQPIPDHDRNNASSAHHSVVVQPLRRSICSLFNIAVLILILVALSAAVISTMLNADSISQQIPVGPRTPITVYQTANNFTTDRLLKINSSILINRGFNIPSTPLGFNNVKCHSNQDEVCSTAARITVNTEKIHQMIIGFGGAFTESAAFNFDMLPQEIQDNFMELYFGKTGIGYNMGRVHINSCDFALGTYSFDEVKDDYELEHFDYTVKHDQERLIPFIVKAMKASARPIKILASPWSPPYWMKEPVKGEQKMTGSADPQGLRNESKVQNAWANYLIKFIDAYGWQGVPLWGITVQNEPKFAAPWEALKMTDDFQRDFVHDHLGPLMEKQHPEMKLLIFDHNKNNMTAWIKTVMKKKNNYKYVSGVAFHWYAGSDDREMDGTYGYDEVNSTYHYIPDKILLASEGCSCPGVLLNDWFRAERFAHDVIYDLQNYVQGWLDWNLLLDADGGPNHLGNNCDAPILLTSDYQNIQIQPKYYYMGHFSKFLPYGSRRVASSVIGNYNYAKTDARVRAGIELGLHGCEKSSRQMWSINMEENLLQLSMSSLQDGYDKLMCISDGLGDRPFLRMVYCDERNYSQPMRVSHIDSNHLVDESTGLCLGIVNDVAEAGALLELAICNEGDSRQSFHMNTATGEITSKATGLCVTAGWPFLSGVSFIDEADSTVIIIINESPLDSDIIVFDVVRDDYVLLGINGRSMQTIIYT